MKEIEFELPCGKKAKLRELTGTDQINAYKKFIERPDKEKDSFQIWELIARCVEIDQKPIKSYEELLLQLNDKDLSILLLAYQQINMPSPEQIKRVTDFFVSTSKE
jgi:hypothetical protein